MLKSFVKVLKSIFKGPVPEKKRKAPRSTSHTRYVAQPRPPKKAPGKAARSKTKRRSAKSYVKKATSKPSVKPVKIKAEKPLQQKPVKVAKAKVTKPPPPEFFVGEITHYFPKISVVVVKVMDHPLLIGDQIHIKGSVEFSQKVESLQVESKDVRFARRGELVGLKVSQVAKPGDKVFKTKK